MAGQLFFRDCVFDAEARELLRGGAPVELPPRAFETLRILIEARPRAVSQQELYDALWPDTVVEIANLHNVIHALRAAVGDGSRTIIRTIYGYGFAFGADATFVDRDRGANVARFELEIGEDTIPLPPGIHRIGREAGSLIPATSPSISRRHARIVVTESSATIEDLGSRNGTFVGGRRLQTLTVLRPGDRIVFGDGLSAIFQAIAAPDPTAGVEEKEFVRTS